MATMNKISPCLWFDTKAEEAATFYTGIFPNSQIDNISHYGEAGKEMHGKEPGTVLAVAFTLDGQTFLALNAGPEFTFTEAISLQIYCDTQDEVDYYWEKLSDGGDPNAQVCGWLKDRYGLSWQVVPRIFPELIQDQKSEAGQRAMVAMMNMKKLDIAALQNAYDGKV